MKAATLQKRISAMSQDELLRAIYVDTLTGIWNRRAYDEADTTSYVAIVDLDSLKWVNDNTGQVPSNR